MFDICVSSISSVVVVSVRVAISYALLNFASFPFVVYLAIIVYSEWIYDFALLQSRSHTE